MKKRGKGEGSIRQRPDGTYEVRINLGRGDNGKRKTKSVYTDTEREAVSELKRLNGLEQRGQLVATGSPLVRTYLNDWYDTNCDDWRPKTAESYRQAIDRFLIPAFGSLKLEKLSPLHVQNWLTAQKKDLLTEEV